MVKAFALVLAIFMLGAMPPTPTVKTAPIPSPTVASQPLWAQVKATEDHDAQTTNAFNIFVVNYQKFGVSVYLPWCPKAGVATVHLTVKFQAWPATVWCKGMNPKQPGIHIDAPKPEAGVTK
jgi:hypothetical protein